MNLAELLHKAQRASFSNDREMRMAEMPLWKLCGYDSPLDHLRAIKHKVHTTRSNFPKL